MLFLLFQGAARSLPPCNLSPQIVWWKKWGLSPGDTGWDQSLSRLKLEEGLPGRGRKQRPLPGRGVAMLTCPQALSCCALWWGGDCIKPPAWGHRNRHEGNTEERPWPLGKEGGRSPRPVLDRPGTRPGRAVGTLPGTEAGL